MESGLYLVSTPIGNLRDVTARASSVLAGVDVIYAEDTRRTGVLLEELGVEGSLRSLHEHNEASRSREILDRLAAGAACALVSDAGTPGVSDPGRRVVSEALEAGHAVVPIPGPSAVPAALSVSGLPGDRFLFLGFPPRKGGERDAWMERATTSPLTVVVFESPKRVADTLAEWEERGLADRRCALCRELTKRFEEVRRSTVSRLRARLEAEPPRGEVTLVLEGHEPEGWEAARREVAREARRLLDDGASTRDVTAHLRDRYEVPRNDAYELVLELEREIP